MLQLQGYLAKVGQEVDGGYFEAETDLRQTQITNQYVGIRRWVNGQQ